jgi:large subunit ribosomal protein L17
LRHAKTTKKLGRTKSHRDAMIKNLLRSLITYERIKTTVAKAKLARRYAERLISFASDKSVANNRIAFEYLQDRSLVKYLTDEIAPRFKDYNGGYTRILKLGTRPGDSAEMALLELVIKKPKEQIKKAAEKK